MRSGRIVGTLVLLALIALAAWLWWRKPQAAPKEMAPTAAPAATNAERKAADVAEIVRRTPAQLLAYADGLDAPGRTVTDDVRLLESVLGLYRSVCHTTNPVGDNAEITAALTGRNRMRYAFIRPDHPAIDAQGELCDRWGTPYFFHQISGTYMQVRSAGPDRQQWTADDIVGSP